ncbi:4Fe-4S cluster-binding domain-containing protein [bacterium]|nr:4Fe-4S cluster-binding domain-containing protein [bacterium]
MPVSVSRILFPVTTLGPGKRVGIWFQGCSIRCPGCISADTWAQQPSNMTIDELAEKISGPLRDADGVTVSGGEPFEQFQSLQTLLQKIRPLLKHGGDVLVYSGYTINQLGHRLQALSGLIDALISGPFDAQASQTRPLMGSDNQEIHLLTELGQQNFSAFLRPRNQDDDRIDLTMDPDGTAWMAGIPKRGDLERLRSVLLETGVSIRTTVDRQVRS